MCTHRGGREDEFMVRWYCSYSLNHMTWLQALCQRASALWGIWAKDWIITSPRAAALQLTPCFDVSVAGGKQNSEISPWILWINAVFRKAEQSGQFRNKKNPFEIHTVIENYNNWFNIKFQSVWQHADCTLPYNLSQSALHFISVCFISDTCQLKHCNPHEYSLRAVYCMM